MKDFEQWNKDLELIKQDLLNWAMGLNSPGKTWLERNYITLILLVVVVSFSVLLYYYKWYNSLVFIGLILAFIIIRNVKRLFKKNE